MALAFEHFLTFDTDSSTGASVPVLNIYITGQELYWDRDIGTMFRVPLAQWNTQYTQERLDLFYKHDIYVTVKIPEHTHIKEDFDISWNQLNKLNQSITTKTTSVYNRDKNEIPTIILVGEDTFYHPAYHTPNAKYINVGGDKFELTDDISLTHANGPKLRLTKNNVHYYPRTIFKHSPPLGIRIDYAAYGKVVLKTSPGALVSAVGYEGTTNRGFFQMKADSNGRLELTNRSNSTWRYKGIKACMPASSGFLNSDWVTTGINDLWLLGRPSSLSGNYNDKLTMYCGTFNGAPDVYVRIWSSTYNFGAGTIGSSSTKPYIKYHVNRNNAGSGQVVIQSYQHDGFDPDEQFTAKCLYNNTYFWYEPKSDIDPNGPNVFPSYVMKYTSCFGMSGHSYYHPSNNSNWTGW